MPTVAETVTIASPPSVVWPLLSDPALVASCIPGATLSPDQDGDTWKGSIKVKFGPTVAMFKGEAVLSYDHDKRRCTIEGRGIDGRGASRALANGVVSASGTDQTELKVEGEYTVSGPLETFANAGGVHVARALLAEFAANMSKLVAERHMDPPPLQHGAEGVAAGDNGPAASTSSTASTPAQSAATPAQTQRPAPKQAAELNAVSLLWAAFKSWISSLFGKRN